MLGDWGSHFNFDLLVVVSEDVSAQKMESLVSSVFLGSLNNGFGDNPGLIVSDFQFANSLFDCVFWTIVVVDEERAEEHDEIC